MTDATHLGSAQDRPDDEETLHQLEAMLDSMPSQLDETAVAAAPTASEPEPTPTPAPVPAPAAAAPGAPPTPVPVPAPPTPQLPQPQPREADALPPLRLEKPQPPDAKHFRTAGALSVGYWMSVGVGAVGQIASFGSLIAANLEGNMKILGYVAASLGAAFAEITMIGSGASSLKRRYGGGNWRPLLVVACLVCAYATILNVVHWAPIQVGLAIMFGGGSLVGFSAHTMAEHLAAKDYEVKLAAYNAAVEERDAKTEAQNAAMRRATEKALRDSVKAAAPQPVPAPAAAPATASATAVAPKPKPAAGKGGDGAVDKQTAVQLGIERRVTTPATLKAELTKEGFELPSSDTTVKNWCREIKQKLGV